MTITVEATYENGTLKLNQPLPLKEREKVEVTIQASPDVQARLDAVQRSYGILRWTRSLEELDYLAMDPENDVLEVGTDLGRFLDGKDGKPDPSFSSPEP